MSFDIAFFDMSRTLELRCGCRVKMGKVFLLAALQAEKGEAIRCPVHLIPHELVENPLFRDMALEYLALLRIQRPEYFE